MNLSEYLELEPTLNQLESKSAYAEIIHEKYMSGLWCLYDERVNYETEVTLSRFLKTQALFPNILDPINGIPFVASNPMLTGYFEGTYAGVYCKTYIFCFVNCAFMYIKDDDGVPYLNFFADKNTLDTWVYPKTYIHYPSLPHQETEVNDE